MSKISAYDRNSQIELQMLTIKHHSEDKILDILPIMEQFVIYDDFLQPSISAKLVIRDQINLVGTLPIVGGEVVAIKYRTPIHDEVISLEFMVYKTEDREIPNGAENIQMNQLLLCTPEVWFSANVDAVSSYTGSYSDIIDRMLKEIGTKKPLLKEDSIGIVDYVAPTINYFAAMKFCASRANSNTRSPMFFWETTKGYRFKSLKELYRAAQFKFIYIEDRGVSGEDTDPEKTFNTVYSYDYRAGNNRLKQFSQNAFGSDGINIDPINARMVKNNNSYDKMFNENDIKLNKFPLNDDAKDIRKTQSFTIFKNDQSHLNDFIKGAANVFMDNNRIYVNLPGDSNMQSGDVVWLDVPSKSALSIDKELHTSGKWFVRSIKHLINKVTYSIVCELTRDSFDVKV